MEIMQNPHQVRIVVIDYYMSSPIPGLDITYSEFRSAAISQVPVLRCFGSTENGKKICVHIHGVFPYLYIPYDGKGDPDEHMFRIARALDKAINVSFNQASSNAQHVYKISLVSGIPMYGYHSRQHQFFKIYLYNPKLVSKVGDILLRRTALDDIYQPHETHLNFTLQFMIDYNLHGMSTMLISDIKYRSDERSNKIEKTSVCELEADINADHIINRQEILSGKLAVNPGIAALWEDEQQRRRNKGEESQLGSFLELQNVDTDPTKSHLMFQRALRERLAVLDADKDVQKQSLDSSVYPAETPRDSNIQNASIIDIHSSSSLELSLDDTLLNATCSQGLDDTVTPDKPSSLDVTFDEDAQAFLNLLQEMAEEKNAPDLNEENESILSQIVPEEAQDESGEDFLDLSMPLASLATPLKGFSGDIPQLDGVMYDLFADSDDDESLASLSRRWSSESSSQESKVSSTSTKKSKCGRSMPSLDPIHFVEDKLKLKVVVQLERLKIENLSKIEPLDVEKALNRSCRPKRTVSFNKRTPEEIFLDNMRLIQFRINRLMRRRKLKLIGDQLGINYKKAVDLSKKISARPKFTVRPAKRWWLDFYNPLDSNFPLDAPILIEHSYSASKMSIKRTSSTPNMYMNCDGLMDNSSSSEDDQKGSRSKRKRALKRSYAPLGITVTKSPRVSGNLQRGLAENLPKVVIESDELGQKSSSQEPSTEPHKRKLSFEYKSLLDRTISEELKACSYSPKLTSKSKSNIESLKLDTLNLEVTKNNKPVESLKLDKSVPNNLPESDPELFSDGEDLNTSFFKAYLSVSENYDSAKGYKAKEGCSTVFSQSSFANSASSTRSQDDTSSDIPPNQELNVKKDSKNAKQVSSQSSFANSASSMRSQDDTSSDIPPNQELNVKKDSKNAKQVSSQSSFANSASSSTRSQDDTSSDIPPNQELNVKKDSKNVKQVSLQSSFANSASSTRSQDDTSSDIPPNQELNPKNATKSVRSYLLRPAFRAPTKSQVESTLTKYGIPKIRQEEPFYSNPEDYKGITEVGHRVLRVTSKTTAHLPEFDSEYDGLNRWRKHVMSTVAKLPWNANNVSALKMNHCVDRVVVLRPVRAPPSVRAVKAWLRENVKEDVDDPDSEVELSYSPEYDVSDTSQLLLSQTSASPIILEQRKKKSGKKTPQLRDSITSSGEAHNSCEITGISQGFDQSVQNLQAARACTQHQYLTTMVMELHVRTRGDLKPDPQYDCVCAIFYSIFNDIPGGEASVNGVIAVNSLPADLGACRGDFFNGVAGGCQVTFVDSEAALISSLVDLVKRWDPDIIAGYEIELLSWGYLVDRAYVLSINLVPMLGRSQLSRYGKMKVNREAVDSLETSVIGRIVLDVWRIMRHEIALQSYTFESIAYHILHKRVPKYDFKQLTFFWDHRSQHYRHRVVAYYLLRVNTVLELFSKLDFLNRTGELAKLFGILFYEVLSRGSQFRVESMMLRLAKPLNYVPVSPSVNQRAKMKAPEYIALVMEPESKLYTDPVIVLDFQSLYPSMIIAYNYCFTTCIGRVNYLGSNHPFEFGASQLKVPKKQAEKLSKRDLLNYSPCGVAFVKQRVREGILPRMLKEVLGTRFMVKNSMKENRGDENLQKVLHNRQLGLKLIANVTYGYTAANFSGRMCCVEVGDSVVSKGRETLQRAIAMVEGRPEWEAKVVYGDTDSLFVLTPGKSKEEAFEIGKKIADAVTNDNPDPVKLKLEKVYQPCILQTKKRYVGYMYESAEQKEPVYEAKGIETVRRDGCPAVAKMLQKCLTLLFETKNVSLIKSYVLKQFNKIQTGRASIQDLTFAKEYRGASNYKPGACVPALELTRKWTATDKRNEPRRGERVPYVIVNGPPGLPLIRLVRSPRDLLNDSSLRPNALYYITKVIIPPLNRCLNLIGVDVNSWFNEMPRKTTQYLPNSSPTTLKSTISQYFISKICACCAAPTQEGLCANCLKKADVTVLTLSEKLKRWEESYYNALLICQTCCTSPDEITCTSLDCPVLYRRSQTFNDLQQSSYVRDLLSTTEAFSCDQWF